MFDYYIMSEIFGSRKVREFREWASSKLTFHCPSVRVFVTTVFSANDSAHYA